jgi:pimeloyl-ACP methyl ester carboxylesterase
MNRHELLDVIPLRATGKVIGDERKLFARSLDSEGYEAHLDAVSAEVPPIDQQFKRGLRPDSLVGEVDAGVFVGRWLGRDYPTVVYVHGTREQPFSRSRLKNSFKRILLDADQPVRANLIAVRAPFHTLGIRAYLDRLTEASNLMAMLAVPVELVERVVDQLGDSHVVVAGLSLGGFVANLHRAFHDTADAYAPLLAGTLYSDVVLEGAFRHVTAERARRNPQAVRELVDFEEQFRQASTEVRPLLARYDANVRLKAQRRAYGDVSVETIEKGHLTGTMATEALREHVLSGLKARASATPE